MIDQMLTFAIVLVSIYVMFVIKQCENRVIEGNSVIGRVTAYTGAIINSPRAAGPPSLLKWEATGMSIVGYSAQWITLLALNRLQHTFSITSHSCLPGNNISATTHAHLWSYYSNLQEIRRESTG